MQPPVLDVKLDEISVFHKCESPARSGFRTHVKHYRRGFFLMHRNMLERVGGYKALKNEVLETFAWPK